MIASPPLQIQVWPVDRLVFYARNPRKNGAAVERMVASIREFGFKIPVLAARRGSGGRPSALESLAQAKSAPGAARYTSALFSGGEIQSQTDGRPLTNLSFANNLSARNGLTFSAVETKNRGSCRP